MGDPASFTCTCTEQGYSPDCPQAFMQNGRILHTLDGEVKLKPRVYGSDDTPPPPSVRDAQEEELARAFEESSLGSGESPKSIDEPEYSVVRRVNAPGRMDVMDYRVDASAQRPDPLAAATRFFNEDQMQTDGRRQLPRFAPLSLGGRTITDATIGGFKLDLAKTAERAAAFVPLPPVFLPIIFADKELNFTHHFFQGMEILVGRKFLEKVTSSQKHSESGKEQVLPTIKRLITSGYLEGDTDLTTFVKRVLSATFDTVPQTATASGGDVLIVAANLYGFQYLEQAMRCSGADIGMWLHMEHMKFRMSWFNSFKSSGIPSFALAGVQDRYESDKNLSVNWEPAAVRSSAYPPAYSREDDYESGKARNSSGRRHHGRKSIKY